MTKLEFKGRRPIFCAVLLEETRAMFAWSYYIKTAAALHSILIWYLVENNAKLEISSKHTFGNIKV